MAFKKGDAAEVSLRRNGKHYGWYPAKVMSADANGLYTVSYDLLLIANGNAVVEQVYAEDVRPQPPFYAPIKEDYWTVGKAAEVLDTHCWRAARIKKILGNGQYFLQIIDSIMIRRYHMRYLRIPQVWDGTWASPNCDKENWLRRADNDQMSSSYQKRKGSCVNSLAASNTRFLKKVRTSDGYGDYGDEGNETEGIYKFQMAAYQSSLEALHESGPLSWEKEESLVFLEDETQKEKDRGAGSREIKVKDGFGLTVLNWRLTGIGALCSMGTAAATTIGILIVGGRQHQKQQRREKKMHLEMHADEKWMKEVVEQATRLNQALTAVRGVPMTRARISFGGYCASV